MRRTWPPHCETDADSQAGTLDEMEIDSADDGTLRWEVAFIDAGGKDQKVSRALARARGE